MIIGNGGTDPLENFDKIWNPATEKFESAIIGVEYYSSNQNHESGVIIYRQYFDNTGLPSDLTTGNNVSNLYGYIVEIKDSVSGKRQCFKGYNYITALKYIILQFNGLTGKNNLSLFVGTDWAIVHGWVDYSK